MNTTHWSRFWKKVKVTPEGCWLWTAGKYSNGYGLFTVSGKPPRKNALAHRYAYEHLVGPVPEGMDLDHTCRVRHCVNPAHLEPVTRSENLRRSPLMGRFQSQKTHCPQGHPLSGDNLYEHAGKRQCRQCRLEQKQRKHAKLRRTKKGTEELRSKWREYAKTARIRRKGRLEVPNAIKTHCPKGHPYEGENLLIEDGVRRCRTCRQEQQKRAYLKRKAKRQSNKDQTKTH